ncbi:MAG: hypothetical protein HAW62_06040 [Endozoicomonadaceae bacterium]|nr:hypothetical protein [Endozoicomonadaceae bacterium]
MSINLLPWRDYALKHNKQTFKLLLICACFIGISIISLSYVYLNYQSNQQQKRIQFLKTTMTDLTKNIQNIQNLEKIEENLFARINIIQTLQKYRSNIVEIFNTIAFKTPQKMYLTSLKMTNNTLMISGISAHNNYISEFMRQLELSAKFQNPHLIGVHTLPMDQGNRFELSVQAEILSSILNKSGLK